MFIGNDDRMNMADGDTTTALSECESIARFATVVTGGIEVGGGAPTLIAHPWHAARFIAYFTYLVCVCVDRFTAYACPWRPEWHKAHWWDGFGYCRFGVSRHISGAGIGC